MCDAGGMPTEPCLTSAVELAREIRDGERSPVEVVEAHLDRIEERDEAVNAFVTIADERARAAAESPRASRASARARRHTAWRLRVAERRCYCQQQ